MGFLRLLGWILTLGSLVLFISALISISFIPLGYISNPLLWAAIGFFAGIVILLSTGRKKIQV